MDDMGRILLDSAGRLFGEMLDVDAARRAEAGGAAHPGWDAIEEAGLPIALVPEAAGGFGVGIADAVALVRAAARHPAPNALAEAMLGNWLLASAGFVPAGGRITVAPLDLRDDLAAASTADGGWRLTGRAQGVPAAAGAAVALLARGESGPVVLLVPADAAPIETHRNIAGEARDIIAFDLSLPAEAGRAAPAWLTPVLVRAMGAALRTSALAGALEAVLDLAIEQVRTRSQFGKPIGQFQAIQHMLAVAAAEVAAGIAAADMAAEAIEGANEGAIDLFALAAAKGRASEAAGKVTAIAQQVHGAMGMTREHPLHFFTLRLLAWRDECGNEADWYAQVGRSIAGQPLWPMVAAA